MALLNVCNFGKRFGKTEVLKDISFDLEEGKTLAIIGSSGSGKTTLLRCLNFLETPDVGKMYLRGDLLFDAADKNKKSETAIREKRLHFGLVFQSFNLFPQYTAFENICLAPRLRAAEQKNGGSGKAQSFAEIAENAERLLARVGLTEKRDCYPDQLSGGQQQRVAIARALALKPDVLCFDEPTSALDPELTGEVLKVLRQLAGENTTMIIVTHEMAFAREVADEIIFMDGGVIESHGSPELFFGDNCPSERLRAFIGSIQK